MKRTYVLGAIALLALTGCTGPSPSQTATATRSPSPSSTASSTASPSGDAAPIDAPATPAVPAPPVAAETPMTAKAAYEICTTTVADTYATAEGGTPADYDFRPFEESTVVDRGDGLFFVLSDYTNHHASAGLEEAGSADCYLGGTVEQPYFAAFGTIGRQYADQLDPYNPHPEGQD